MKNLILTAALLLVSLSTFAQTAFEKAMTEKIAVVEDHKTADEFTALANDFDRIGTKEANNWLPYYYAAFATIQKGRVMMRAGSAIELDPVADLADQYIAKAEALSPDNAELYILRKMTSGLRMMADPRSRFMSEMPIGQEALAKAQKLDPNNPRITILQAEDTYYTPEQFGGSKEKGLELFRKALDQFAVYKTKTALDPKWGKTEAEYFLSQK